MKLNFKPLYWTPQQKLPGVRDFLAYVYDLRWYLAFVLMLFAATAVLGATQKEMYPLVAADLANATSSLGDTPGPSMMIGIFLNNALKSLLMMLLGVAFGFGPVLFVATNGVILGIICAGVAEQYGPLYVAVGILPHGVLELSLVFLSAAMGLRLGADVLLIIARKAGLPLLKEDFRKTVIMFLVWLTPLFLIAAAIETFITVLALSMV